MGAGLLEHRGVIRDVPTISIAPIKIGSVPSSSDGSPAPLHGLSVLVPGEVAALLVRLQSLSWKRAFDAHSSEELVAMLNCLAS